MTTAHRRGFGNIRKLPSGRFQARYTAPDGRKIPAATTFRHRIDAEGWLHERARDLDAGRWREVEPERVTFAAYAEAWLRERHVNGRPLRPRTVEHYGQLLDRYLLPTFGPRLLASITPGDVKRWHAATLTDRPTMRSHAYGLLRTVLGSAVTDELLTVNPARIPGAGRGKTARKIRPASVAEITALADAMPERLRLMVLLGSWCALRFGEVIELRRGDIDLNAEQIHVRRAAVRTSAGHQITDPKSEAGVRDVSIPPHLLPMIEDHLAKYVGNSGDSLLFPAENGGHLQPSTFNRWWYKARDKAGRPDLRFHDLRHSGAVLAALTGATLKELMDRLGHSTPAAALRYQHTAQGRDRELAALLSKLADA